MPGSTEAVLRQRVATQHLMDPLPTATAVVGDLLCVQAQEYAHAFWSLGLRSQDQTLRQVRSQFDSGAFVRTHILRPTWHYVAATDIAAVLKLTSPRVQRRNAGRYRDLGLDVDTLARSAELVMELLRGGQFRTRAQIGAHLSQYGLAASGPRLAYLVMNAELEGLICSGPMAGAQHTYALLEERAPRWLPVAREELLTEVVFRFFAGHGPATSSDLVRWSSCQVPTSLPVSPPTRRGWSHVSWATRPSGGTRPENLPPCGADHGRSCSRSTTSWCSAIR